MVRGDGGTDAQQLRRLSVGKVNSDVVGGPVTLVGELEVAPLGKRAVQRVHDLRPGGDWRPVNTGQDVTRLDPGGIGVRPLGDRPNDVDVGDVVDAAHNDCAGNDHKGEKDVHQGGRPAASRSA